MNSSPRDKATLAGAYRGVQECATSCGQPQRQRFGYYLVRHRHECDWAPVIQVSKVPLFWQKGDQTQPHANRQFAGLEKRLDLHLASVWNV